MTRKDYDLIAAAINETADGTANAQHLQALRDVANNLADALAPTNPTFDRDRFLSACGF